ncbi:protein translocase subunit SecF [Marinimicrobium sp. ABcell2]|nr:protein translocase subunit SecF [Marinimicrobium sp. ABcell2]MDQ2077250.1 protein translocase subunit SecF [Marinimicrobium sp. ABcell2]
MHVEKTINFMGMRKTALTISFILLVISIGSLVTKGLNLGLDFTGGTQLELGFEEPVNLNRIREVLGETGLENPVVVLFGSDTEVLIRTQESMEDEEQRRIERRLVELDPQASVTEVRRVPSEMVDFTQIVQVSGVSEEQLRESGLFSRALYGSVRFDTVGDSVEVAVERSLDNVYISYLMDAIAEATDSRLELRRSEFVGPQIGEELRDEGGLGLLFALFVVMAYVALRFQYKFAFGAVLALIHDVIIVVGIFSLLGMEFDLTVLAALLAVIGYSLNDTIVVYDRIRENFRLMRRGTTEEVINSSLTQMLERTLITSLTTLMVLLILFFMGGELIRGFSAALIAGVVIGTYSSIYISANLLVSLQLTKEDLMPPPKEGEDQEPIAP